MLKPFHTSSFFSKKARASWLYTPVVKLHKGLHICLAFLKNIVVTHIECKKLVQIVFDKKTLESIWSPNFSPKQHSVSRCSPGSNPPTQYVVGVSVCVKSDQVMYLEMCLQGYSIQGCLTVSGFQGFQPQNTKAAS